MSTSLSAPPPPLILCGPVLRRVDDGRVAVWLALSEARELRLTVCRPDGSVVRDTRDTANQWTKLDRIGTKLWIGLVEVLGEIVPRDRDDAPWSYSLEARAEGDATGSPLQVDPKKPVPKYPFHPVPTALSALRIAHGSCRALKESPVRAAPKAPAIDQPVSPKIILDSATSRGSTLDTMVGIAALLNGTRHPHQLFLTGDQIYADSVPKTFLPFMTWIGRDVLGVPATLPELDRPGGEADSSAIFARYPPLFRQSIIRWEAGFTAKSTNHLLDFSEFVACYLLSWSPALWTCYADYFAREIAPKVAEQACEDPPLSLLTELATARPIPEHVGPLPARETLRIADGSDLATLRDIRYAERGRSSTLSLEDLAKRWVQDLEFWARDARWTKLVEASEHLRTQLQDVARVLASVPTYMICDDHEISDDWYATRGWRERVFSRPLGTAVVRNGLMAYTVCQAWGNDPERWCRGRERALLTEITGLLDSGLTPARQESLNALLGLPCEHPDGGREPTFRPKVRFDYVLYGARWPHRVYVLDGRTCRHYPNRDGTAGSLDFLGRSTPTASASFAASAMAQQLPDRPLGAPASQLPVVVAAIPVLVPDTLPLGLLPAQTLIPTPALREVDAEAWAFNLTNYEALLRRLTQLGDVVLLSGDIHLSYAAVLDYWRGERPARRLVQFVASGFTETWGSGGALVASHPALIEAIAGLNPTEFYPAERLGWGDPHGEGDAPRGPVLRTANGQDAAMCAAVPPDLRARLQIQRLRSADGGDAPAEKGVVVVPARGWPVGVGAAAPDWSWRSWLLRDGDESASNPAAEAQRRRWDPAHRDPAQGVVGSIHAAGRLRSVFGRTFSLGPSFGLVSFEGAGAHIVARQDLYGALPAEDRSAVEKLPIVGDDTEIFLHTRLSAPLSTPGNQLPTTLAAPIDGAEEPASTLLLRASRALLGQLIERALDRGTRSALTDMLHDLNQAADGDTTKLKAALLQTLLSEHSKRRIGSPTLLDDLAAIEREQSRLNESVLLDATPGQALSSVFAALAGPLAQRSWSPGLGVALGALAATQLPSLHRVGLVHRALTWPWRAFCQDFSWVVETDNGVVKALSPALVAVALPPWMLARLLLLPGQLGGLLTEDPAREANQAASILWLIGGVLAQLPGDEDLKVWSGWEPDSIDGAGEGDTLSGDAGIARRTLRLRWRHQDPALTTPVALAISLEHIHGGPALRIELDGAIERRTALRWGLELDASLSGGGSFWLRLPRPGDLDRGWGGGEPVQSLSFALALRRAFTLRFAGIEATFRPEISLRLGAQAGKTPQPIAELMFRLAGDEGLCIRPDPDAHGLLALLLPGDGVRIPLPLEVGYRVGEGWVFGGLGYALVGLGALSLASVAAPEEGPLSLAEAPHQSSLASFHRVEATDRSAALNVDALRISAVKMSWGREGDDARLSFTGDLALRMGPLQLGLSLGLGLHAGVHPDSEEVLTYGGGLSWRDIWFDLDSRVVSGGGALVFRDKDHWGAGLCLRVLDRVSVTALVSVERIDEKLSFVAMLCGTDLRVPIGLGFQLEGVGGLVGLNRAPEPDAIAKLLKGDPDATLFPSHQSLTASGGLARALSALTALFPFRADHLSLGPTLQLSWRGILRVTMAVVLDYDLKSDAVHRLMLFGQGRLEVLPSLGRYGVNLRFSLLTSLDLSVGELHLDGKIEGTLAGMDIQGDLRGWLGWGQDRGFLFSAGGFHPQWIAGGLVPQRMEGLRRISAHWNVSLASLLKLSVQFDGYLAISPNTVQLGAEWRLGAEVAGGLVSFHARISADCLIQFSPFSLDIWLKGSGSIRLGVSWSVRAELRLRLSEGQGSVYVHLHKSMPWWCPDICWSDTYTLWKGGAPTSSTCFELLNEALADSRSWTSSPLYPDAPAVELSPEAGQRLLPDSALLFRQGVVPLHSPLTRLDGRDGDFEIRPEIRSPNLRCAPFDADIFDMTPFRAPDSRGKAERALGESPFAKATSGLRLSPEVTLGASASAPIDEVQELTVTAAPTVSWSPTVMTGLPVLERGFGRQTAKAGLSAPSLKALSALPNAGALLSELRQMGVLT